MQYLMVIDLPEILEENIQLSVMTHQVSTRLGQKQSRFSSATTSNSHHQEPTAYMEIGGMNFRPLGPLNKKETPRKYELDLCLY
ncbi:hypothetical protein AYI69_g6357 [Smittium culicis]|uniref:Uncharacterized protein n=1 Tax=Smittium culicis TaxID=133412 RepID=A0A1R1XZG9_9FUNG|nr:hypothetical protein AYI69_g6357 [Smittium culicis]